MPQQASADRKRPYPHGETVPRRRQQCAKRLGLRYVARDELTIRRVRRGKGWSYLRATGRVIRNPSIVKRLARLAVPPAYEAVVYADDPAAHLQAVGRDAAGRLQYRYHPDWEKVRETTQGPPSCALAEDCRASAAASASISPATEPTRELALSAVIELVGCSAIRAGPRDLCAAARHARCGDAAEIERGDRRRSHHAFAFRGKGGKVVAKEVRCPRLVGALECLRTLPGPRLFQYRAENGEVRQVRARDANAFLREIAGVQHFAQGFPHLDRVREHSRYARSRQARRSSERQRRKQVMKAIRAAADDLHNTPAICRRSYVHGT